MDGKELVKQLARQLGDFTDNEAGNYIGADKAFSPEDVGLRLYDRPLVAVGSAGDPLFEEYRKTKAVGPQSMLPGELLPGAASVISYFFPMSEQVRVSNRGEGRASNAWFYARIDGQAFILSAGRYLVGLLEEMGYGALCPAGDPRFGAVFVDDDPSLAFRSTWSERHAAYACGLGTFSLSKGLITEAGIAGRFGSVITSAPLPVTVRAYTGLYDYCIMCGMCAKNCPVNAISLQDGKDHYPCYDYLQISKKYHRGYYGCGKCQVSVPCEFKRPAKHGRTLRHG